HDGLGRGGSATVNGEYFTEKVRDEPREEEGRAAAEDTVGSLLAAFLTASKWCAKVRDHWQSDKAMVRIRV
ncbi:hypothetical protein HK405_006108, partial [Cladochytrium tenue]